MNSGLKKSIALHLAVFVVWMVDFPMFWWNKTPAGQVPIIVDLKDVKISDMTNLPPKAKFGAEDKEASKIKRKDEKKYTTEAAQPKSEPEPVKEQVKTETKEPPAAEPEPVKKDFLVAPQPKKPQAKPQPKVPEKKPQPKTPDKKPQPQKKPENKNEPQLANPLKSLLASVDALEKEGEKSETATIKEGTQVANMGIEGGTAGSYFSELSISELDALAGQLRACWNLDPGAMGIEDMIVEIKVELNQEGKPVRVDIQNTARYSTDSHFRSVADSARRAVYVCAPYKILSEKYADKYDKWRILRLRFNPVDQSIQ
jgi:outer membrane biosynthesis protein TonB